MSLSLIRGNLPGKKFIRNYLNIIRHFYNADNEHILFN